MSRAVLLALLVALAPLTGAAVAGDTVGIQDEQTTDRQTTEPNGNNSTSGVAPGARLAGVVGSQGAAIDGEISERSLRERLARANGSEAKAAVVAEALGNANATLDDVEARLAELQAEREAGNISEGTYRAKVAIVAQRGVAARAVANRSGEATDRIPAAALRERGIGHGTARNVSERAGRVVGQDVAEIARGIRGGGPPDRAGRPGGFGGPGGPMGPNGTPGGQPDAENRTPGGGNGPGPGNGPGGVGGPPNGTGSDAGPGENGTGAGPGNTGVGPAGNHTGPATGPGPNDGTDAGPNDGNVTDGDGTDTGNGTDAPDRGGPPTTGEDTTETGDGNDTAVTTTEPTDEETDTSTTLTTAVERP